MRTISFSTEMGINPSFDSEHNDDISANASDIGSVVQSFSKEVFAETGIHITAIVSGPNRSCYDIEWGCPKGGETTYQIHGNSDYRLQLESAPYKDTVWKKAVVLLVYKIKTYYLQEYALIEFTDSDGVDSYVISPDISLNDIYDEIEQKTDNNLRGL